MTTESYKNDLLYTWEETYKKGQLTLWIFLALKDGEKYVNEIRKQISNPLRHFTGNLHISIQVFIKSFT